MQPEITISTEDSDEDIILEYIKEERWHINEFLCFLYDYKLKDNEILQILSDNLSNLGLDTVDPVDVLDVISAYCENLTIDNFHVADSLFDDTAGMLYANLSNNTDIDFSKAGEYAQILLPRVIAHIMTLEQLDYNEALTVKKAKLRSERCKMNGGEIENKTDNPIIEHSIKNKIKRILKSVKNNVFVIIFILLCIGGLVPSAINMGAKRFILSILFCVLGLYIYYLLKNMDK